MEPAESLLVPTAQPVLTFRLSDAGNEASSVKVVFSAFRAAVMYFQVVLFNRDRVFHAVHTTVSAQNWICELFFAQTLPLVVEPALKNMAAVAKPSFSSVALFASHSSCTV